MKKIVIVVLLLLTLTGCQNIEKDQDMVLFREDMIAVYKDDKWGYINTNGDVSIEFKYVGAGQFYNGTAIVKTLSGYQLIDKKGNLLLDDSYHRLYRSDNGYITYTTEDLKVGLMNEKGQIITEALYDYIRPFNDGLALINLNGKYNYINIKGQLVLEDDLMYKGSDFSHGYARIQTDDNQYNYIDKNGDYILEEHVDYAYNFDVNQHGIIQEDDKYHLVDSKGQYILSDKYQIISSGVFYITRESSHYSLYDKDGTYLRNLQYDIFYNAEGYVISGIEDMINVYKLLDESGNVIETVPSEHGRTWLHPFDYNKTALIEYTSTGFIVYSGQNKVSFEADELLQIIDDNRYVIRIDEKAYIVSSSGEILLDPNANIIVGSDDGYFPFTDETYYGIYNSKYELIVEAIYEMMNTEYNIIENWV